MSRIVQWNKEARDPHRRAKHMRHSERTGTKAWAVTDVYGEIQSASLEARELLGLPSVGPRNMLRVFPQWSKALVFDMQVALTGWPTGRTLVLERIGVPPTAIRYRVSRRIGVERVELFWHLERDEPFDLPDCA